jgi:hypothetical protein
VPTKPAAQMHHHYRPPPTDQPAPTKQPASTHLRYLCRLARARLSNYDDHLVRLHSLQQVLTAGS